MPNPNYEKGRRLEYKIKRKLEKEGLFVCRSAGSHGVDLVAIEPGVGQVYFISCKTNEYIPPEERKQLLEISRKYHALPFITHKAKNRWDIERVLVV
jgi:Holliday junction resolvase